jgi:large subunit ribosomal protein L33
LKILLPLDKINIINMLLANGINVQKTMAKKNTILVKLASSAGTGFFFVKKRNPKKLTTKLSFRKYDPIARKHVLFEEKKLSS